MPTVGTGKNAKRFPYTPKGEAAARKEAKATGQPMQTMPGRGGRKSAQPPFMKKKSK